ncbi:MAG: NADP-dependent oxidoreductase [Gammaproteobacteria bacterium]|nr:NADP-dependent oxidoreductase [Gammaproteobacteria bacterium]
MKSREVRLVSRPVGLPKPEDFTVVEIDLPDPGEGEIAVKNVSLTVDPYMRGRMVDRKSYVAGFELSETLTGGAIGRVEASNDSNFSVGDYVESSWGWREAWVNSTRGVRKLGELKAPASAYLGILGMPGMTAYVGLLDVGQLKEGETVFVSGAAGAVGSAVGQIAKIKNCTAIGSAGGPEKAQHLVDDLGFDHGIDYREGNLTQQLMQCAPQGLDVYFDNVGGDHLEAALNCMRPNGRLPLCGAISQYNATEPVPGPRNLAIAIGSQLTLKGFIVSNYNHLRDDFMRDMTDWVLSGQLKYRETIFEGIDNMPDAFIGLFTGANTGKMIVNLE